MSNAFISLFCFLKEPLSFSTISIAYGGGTFVSVGSNGGIESSPDAINWSNCVSGTTSALTSVAYGNGVFVAVGWGVMLFSEDGLVWRVLANSGIPSILSAVEYGNGRFVAVGGSGISINGGGTVLSSPDGESNQQKTPDFSGVFSF